MSETRNPNEVIDAYELELAKSTLGIYNTQYADLSDRWKAIDTKAQGSVAIAGIFIGGVFTLARDITCKTSGDEVRLMIVVVVFLLSSSICSALALLARKARRPLPEGPQLKQWDSVSQRLDRLRPTDNADDGTKAHAIRDACSVAIGYFGDTFGPMRDAVFDMEKVVERKAGLLQVGQILLLIAIGCGAVLVVVTIAYRSIVMK